MQRREFVKRSLEIAVSVAALQQKNLLSQISSYPDLAVVTDGEPQQLVQNALTALGGIERFISRNDTVVIKPNISWDRVPKQGATTNPESVAEVVRQCYQAGAKDVKVFDNTLNEARRCYKRSGIEQAVKDAGGKVLYVQERKFKQTVFPDGELVKSWEIYDEVLEADKLINMPCTKHHSISGVSLSMKNLMGLIGGVRGKFHRQYDTKIVDLNTRIKPTLILLDAYRMLMRNGPSGGNLADVQLKKTMIAGVDPVAIDSYGATLFGHDPKTIEFLVQANQRGLGQINLNQVNTKLIRLNA